MFAGMPTGWDLEERLVSRFVGRVFTLNALPDAHHPQHRNAVGADCFVWLGAGRVKCGIHTVRTNVGDFGFINFGAFSKMADLLHDHFVVEPGCFAVVTGIVVPSRIAFNTSSTSGRGTVQRS